MAAGLSLPKDHYLKFVDAFDAEVRRLLTPADLEAEILTDGVLDTTELNIDTAQLLREAGPWGQHFPEPLFEGEFHIVQQRIVGEKHLKLLLALDESKKQLIDAIAFNVGTDIWPDPAAEKVRLIYKLDINLWRGRESIQLLVEHLG